MGEKVGREEGGKKGRKGEGEGEKGRREEEGSIIMLKDLKVLSCNVCLTAWKPDCLQSSINSSIVHTWMVSLKCRILPWDSALTWNTALLSSSLWCSHLSNDASNLITWEEGE